MDSNYWKSKWDSDDTRFHRDEFNPALIQYFSGKKPGKIFVPFCGKSRDLVWLAQQGHQVIGCEWIEKACEDFFKENKIPLTLTEKETYKIFSGKNIEILCGDFFLLPDFIFSGITAWYDRAALIALPEEMRKSYEQKILEVSKQFAPSFEMLLMTVEYNNPEIQGPPFAVFEKEVRESFEKVFTVELLGLSEDLSLKIHPKFQGTSITDPVYRLKKR